MEEMLNTWKQHVPGSTSTQPVFCSEMTRRIDTALIKAKTAALQNERNRRQPQEHLGLVQPQDRSTVLQPPQKGFDYRKLTSTNESYHTVGIDMNHTSSSTVSYATAQSRSITPTPQLPSQVLPQLSSLAFGGNGVDTLHSDISNLIESSQKACFADPYNLELHKRLKALLDLSTLLQSQQVPNDQLALVREQVRKIANRTPPPSVVNAPPSPSQPVQFSTQDLAMLLQATTAAPQFPVTLAPAPITAPLVPQPAVSLPFLPPAVDPVSSMSCFIPSMAAPLPVATASPSTDSNAVSLFENLQRYGLLPNHGPPTPQPTPPSAATLPSNFSAPGLRGNVPRPVAPTQSGNRNWRSIDVELRPRSLQMYRMIHRFRCPSA